MPYRIDLIDAPPDALDRLVELGALDVEWVGDGQSVGGAHAPRPTSPALATPSALSALSALMPDGVEPAGLARALGVTSVTVSPAVGRDEGSVWVLTLRPFKAGRWTLVPAGHDALPSDVRPDLQPNAQPSVPPADAANVIRLVDGVAFGTGLHPSTVLCLELLDEMLEVEPVSSLLDVGIGSGILAIAGLVSAVPSAVGVDIDADALAVAAQNAELNGVADRLRLLSGGPEALDADATARGSWPLVLANVLAAPLIDMAPQLVRRIAHRGRLVLSGIPQAVAPDVERAYVRLGMRPLDSRTRGGWTALVLIASW